MVLLRQRKVRSYEDSLSFYSSLVHDDGNQSRSSCSAMAGIGRIFYIYGQ